MLRGFLRIERFDAGKLRKAYASGNDKHDRHRSVWKRSVFLLSMRSVTIEPVLFCPVLSAFLVAEIWLLGRFIRAKMIGCDYAKTSATSLRRRSYWNYSTQF